MADTRVDRARGGDAKALQDLLQENRERILRFVTAMLGDPHEAEDVLQATWESAQGSIAKFESRCAFSTWVYQIALNRARRILRDRGRHAKVSDPEALDMERPAARTVLSSIYRRDLNENIERSIDELPLSLKEAFVLRYLEGREFEEIAEITGAAVNTVYVRAHRARVLLRSSLGSVVDTYWTEQSEKPKARRRPR